MKTNKFLQFFRRGAFFAQILFIFVIGVNLATAQTTEFTYQGRLTDGAVAANANYDFEFQLYAALTGGALIGTRTRLSVPVINGVFTVRLDFLPSAFNGTDRYLEIAVKPAGNPGGFQQLLPRQPITYAPYSFRSLNATNADTAARAEDSLQLGGIAANQFILTGDARLTNARVPLAGSGDYLQNRTTPQPGTSFNISGNGTLGGTLSTTGVINTNAQYNLANNRVLGIGPSDSIFVGLGAGANNIGSGNSFFGRSAGNANTSSTGNSFFGYQAGLNSVGGGLVPGSNSFFGSYAGQTNTTGNDNSFFGSQSGRDNTTAYANTFFGNSSGANTTQGCCNAFFGGNAGLSNTTGESNAFFGVNAGNSNTTGVSNTIIGNLADVGSGSLNYATAIGATATVSTSNTIALGRSNGSDFVLIPGFLTLPNLAVAGSTTLCRNAFDRVGTCSSSLRYKTNVQTFFGGLDIVTRLRPITFNWKDGGMSDVGFAAEEVNEIEPLLTTRNDKGEIEGVKYAQITTVLVNAVNQQQTQIENQKEQIEAQKKLLEQQQQQIDALKKSLCQSNQTAEICKQ